MTGSAVWIQAWGLPALRSSQYPSSTTDINTDIFHSPTITDDGTEITGAYIAGGSGPGKSSSGGVVALHNDAEFILKTNTNYLIRVTNDSAEVIDVKLEWYE